MNASKAFDISKSSIVGLKAELLRKQEEVKRLKELQQGNVKPEIVQKKKSVLEKSNEGVEKRRAKDRDSGEVDYDALQKSREVLEAKSRLYDKLKSNTVDAETKSRYLIDFDLKREIEKGIPSNTEADEDTKQSENEEDYSDTNSDPENDWVDFVDTLGRSRRCLRKDLPEMRAKDTKLAATLRPPSPPQDTTPAPTPELLSWDMQREMMRKKWEEQETQLLGKKDIHYQDVRFDEARPHGVGYFEFSTDEAERARQQEELQKLRTQTEQQQEAAQGLRARREQQLQARLAAARRRRRERLGLPPESPPHEPEMPTIDNEEEEKKGVEEESIIDLEESVKKIAPIRPWDIGKNGVAPVMSQEEWVEKKRQERPEEFAPPRSLIETTNLADDSGQKWKSNPNVFTTKKPKQKLSFTEQTKKKHKKSRYKKEEELRPSEEEEDSFGPSVEDWKSFSQQHGMSSENPNVVGLRDNYSTQEHSQSTTVNSDVSTAQIRNTNIPGPSHKPWKPTISDIDQLLSKSRSATFNTPVEETNENYQSPSNQKLAETQEPTNIPSFIRTDNSSLDINTHTVNRRNVNNTAVNSKRTNHNKDIIKRNEAFDIHESSETIIKPIVNLLEIDSDDEDERSLEKCGESNNDKWKSNKRKFAAIPPPSSMSYYIDGDKKNSQKSSIKPQLADSISAGMNYLKSQNEEKSKKRLKGMLDII